MDFFGRKTELAATIIDGTNTNGYLVFDDQSVAFYPHFKNRDEIHIPYTAIYQVFMDEDYRETSRYTFTRLFFLKMYALAFPKRNRTVSTSLMIETDQGNLSFLINGHSLSDVWQKIAPYLDAHTIPVNR